MYVCWIPFTYLSSFFICCKKFHELTPNFSFYDFWNHDDNWRHTLIVLGIVDAFEFGLSFFHWIIVNNIAN
jgi:hypothetical protein